ncbi:MAG: hypothetical protein GY701_35380, partial [Sulfitobacter sp.]|nr:hypothetical protein [Sulfitobacter sp.]
IDVNGDGDAAHNPAPVVHDNDIYGNASQDYRARNFGDPNTTVLDARGNWWGTEDVLAINNNIYDRQDSSSSPWVDFGGWLTGERDAAFVYRILNPRGEAQPAQVVSYTDGGLIQGPVNDLYLDRYELGTLPVADLAPGSRLSANTRFALGAAEADSESAVAEDLAGTEFVVPQVRGHHIYHLLAPEVDAVAQITLETIYGSITRAVFLPAGEAIAIDMGEDNGQAGRIESDWPILVQHDTEAGQDVYAVPPAEYELWGVKSQSAYVVAYEDGTTIQVVADDGTSETLLLDAGELVAIGVGNGAAQGQGSAIHLLADKPIAGVQHDDGDGESSTAFWPAWLHSLRHALPVDAQYAAIVCPESTLLTLTDTAGSTDHDCTSVDGSPDKLFFGGTETGAHLM